MSTCCPPKIKHKPVTACPYCQQKGRAIAIETLKSQLKPLFMRELKAEATYYFCAHPTCSAVYFQQEQVFELEQIREKVFQKNQEPDCLVCYCFGFTRGEVMQDAQTNTPQILNQIKTGTKNKQCACELRNPQGRCCLGNIADLQTQATSKNASLLSGS